MKWGDDNSTIVAIAVVMALMVIASYLDYATLIYRFGFMMNGHPSSYAIVPEAISVPFVSYAMYTASRRAWTVILTVMVITVTGYVEVANIGNIQAVLAHLVGAMI